MWHFLKPSRMMIGYGMMICDNMHITFINCDLRVGQDMMRYDKPARIRIGYDNIWQCVLIVIKYAWPHQTIQDQEVQSECEEAVFWSNCPPHEDGETPEKNFMITVFWKIRPTKGRAEIGPVFSPSQPARIWNWFCESLPALADRLLSGQCSTYIGDSVFELQFKSKCGLMWNHVS